MRIDRRWFTLIALAGAFLAIGIVLGVLTSVNMDWVPAVHAGVKPVAVDLPAPPPNFSAVVKAVTPAVVNISP